MKKDKQRSIKHTYETKDQVRLTPLKTGFELKCYGMVSSSCSTYGTRFTLDTDLVISHEIQQDPEWFYINSIYSVSSVYNLLTFDEFNISINSLNIHFFYWRQCSGWLFQV